MFELIDEQSGKVKKVGTEQECLEFSKQNPSCNYILNDISNDKRKMYKYNKEKEAAENSDNE